MAVSCDIKSIATCRAEREVGWESRERGRGNMRGGGVKKIHRSAWLISSVILFYECE